jgi:tetratricopeptide (TPR) repeat protein
MTTLNFCPECGTKLSADLAKFCTSCGFAINQSAGSVRFASGTSSAAHGAFQILHKGGFEVYPEGVFNVEGGKVNIESQVFKACECESEIRHKEACPECGRSTGNSKNFRAGPGDGMYKVWTLFKKLSEPSTVEDIFGAVVFFDYDYTDLAGLDLGKFTTERDLKLYDFGDLEIRDEISVGESGAQIRVKGRIGKYRVLTLCEIDPVFARSGDKNVAAALEKTFRENGSNPDLAGITEPFHEIPLVVPYVSLILHSTVFDSDSASWNKILESRKFPDLARMFFSNLTAIENGNIQRIENIACYNNYLSSTWSKDEQISWLLEGREIADQDCIDLLNKEIASGYELTLAKEIELLCRRGYIWVAEEKFNSHVQSGAFDPEAACNLAELCHFVNKDFELALKLLQRAYESSTDFLRLRSCYLQITCHGLMGNMPEAIKTHSLCMELAQQFKGMELLVSLEPGVRYGEAFEDCGFFKEALQCYQNVADTGFEGMPSRRALNGIRRIRELDSIIS